MNSIVLAGGAAALLTLGGCGQKGPLYISTDAAASQRATLVETLTPFQTRQQTTPPAQLLMPPEAAPASPAASSPSPLPSPSTSPAPVP